MSQQEYLIIIDAEVDNDSIEKIIFTCSQYGLKKDNRGLKNLMRIIFISNYVIQNLNTKKMTAFIANDLKCINFFVLKEYYIKLVIKLTPELESILQKGADYIVQLDSINDMVNELRDLIIQYEEDVEENFGPINYDFPATKQYNQDAADNVVCIAEYVYEKINVLGDAKALTP